MSTGLYFVIQYSSSTFTNTLRLERHFFKTTQFFRSIWWRYNRFGLRLMTRFWWTAVKCWNKFQQPAVDGRIILKTDL